MLLQHLFFNKEKKIKIKIISNKIKRIFDYLKINLNLFRASFLFLTRCHFNQNIYPGFKIRKLPVIEIGVFRVHIRRFI